MTGAAIESQACGDLADDWREFEAVPREAAAKYESRMPRMAIDDEMPVWG